MIYYGMEWHSLDSYFQMKELSAAPATPPSNEIRLYAKDKSGTSALYYKNDAGTEIDLSAVGSVSIGATVSSGTTGAVLFVKSGPVLGQDASDFWWDTGNKRLGIGNNTPTDQFHIVRSDGTSLTTTYDSYGAGDINIRGRRAKGTLSSPTQVVADDGLLLLSGLGYHSGNAFSAAQTRIGMYGSESWTSSARGSYISFWATPIGSTTIAEYVRINDAGLVGFGTTAPARGLDVVKSDAAGANISVTRTSNNSAGSFTGFNADGAATGANELVALFGGGGSHDGTLANRAITSLMGIYTGEAWTNTAKGSYITLETTPTGSTSRSERFRIIPAGHMRLPELGTDPGTGDLTSLAHLAVYMKNDKFVIAYNNGGTMTYIKIPLDGSTTTWTHNTTAP